MNESRVAAFVRVSSRRQSSESRKDRIPSRSREIELQVGLFDGCDEGCKRCLVATLEVLLEVVGHRFNVSKIDTNKQLAVTGGTRGLQVNLGKESSPRGIKPSFLHTWRLSPNAGITQVSLQTRSFLPTMAHSDDIDTSCITIFRPLCRPILFHVLIS